jgi:hypothetical protein
MRVNLNNRYDEMIENSLNDINKLFEHESIWLRKPDSL